MNILHSSLKNYVLYVFLLIGSNISAQIGIGTSNPQDDAVLDLESTNKAVLFPRVELTDLSVLSPITSQTSGTESLLVYNTSFSTGKGFYYWNGVDRWVPIAGNSNSGLKYYSYNITPTASPNLNNVIQKETADKNGLYTGDLHVTNADFPSSALKPSNNDGFIIRLVGYYTVKTAGVFNFSATSDDGARIYIDDALVVDRWIESSGTTTSGSARLAKGKHKFEFWYYENQINQLFRFQWGANPDGLPTGTMKATQFTMD